MLYLLFIILGIIVLTIITRPFTVFFHELGHAIPLMLLTGKGAIIFIGSFGDQNHSFKLTFGVLDIWFRYKPMKWGGGLCIPKADNIPLNKQFISILGGTIFSVIIAGILFYLTIAFNLHGSLKLICLFALCSTVYDLFTNLIPKKIVLPDGTLMQSDGQHLLYILKLKKFPKEYATAIELYDNQEYSKSSALFEELLNRNFEDEEIYRLAYNSYICIGEFEKAYTLLKKFKGKYELNSDDYYGFGFVCSCLNITEENLSHFYKSLELNPDNPLTLYAIGYELNTQQKYKEAIPYFNKAIALDNNFAYAYNSRGHAKIEMDQLEEGLQDITYSLQLDNENSYAHRNLGIYYLKLKQFHEARKCFLKAKEMDKETAMIDDLISKTN